MFDLTGKVAVVTGAAAGIGSAIAQRLVRAGAKVLIGDLTPFEDEARAWGCDFQLTDVGDPASLTALLERSVVLHGRLDILVSNAGIGEINAIENADIERANRLYKINALSTLTGIREAARRMKRGGSIVNLSSLSGVRVTPGWGEYAMTKAAIIAATQTAAVELGPRGIRVNAVCPGVVGTPGAIVAGGESLIKVMATVCPLGRMGTPEEIAAMVHFLASDDASYVTGQAYMVDGGWGLGTTVATLELAAGQ
jgi:NAD(P)-dependent dehydrogenase (short-subunit alcohol dehydrogenase family)